MMAVPPPVTGASVMTQILLQSADIGSRFRLTHINTVFADSVADLKHFSLKKIIRFATYLWKELRCLVTVKPDLLVCALSTNRNAVLKQLQFYLTARSLRCSVLWYCHDNDLGEFAGSQGTIGTVTRFMIVKSRGVIMVGEGPKSGLLMAVPQAKVYPVANGVPAPRGVRPAWSSKTPPTILFLSNLLPEKGFLEVIRAAPIVRESIPDVRFQIAGSWAVDGDKRLAIERELIRSNTGADVSILGPLYGERKAEALANASLLAFPTYYQNEACPLVVLEAMAWGLPIVTTAAGDLGSIVLDGVNGLRCNPEDVQDLATKCIRLLSDLELAKTISENNLRRHNEQYSVAAFESKVAAVIEGALN